MQRSSITFILKGFLLWRIAITMVAILAINYLSLSGINFFGGKYINYITNPIFWGWANFDGEHYLSIAMFGYKDLQLAFFPGYPFLVNMLSNIFGSSIQSFVWSAIIISNLSFLLSLFIFWKIITLDFSTKVAKVATTLILIFPTSFYFGSVYTESIFLLLSLLTYYLYKKKKYFLAGCVGVLLTLTRLYGSFLLLMIIVDIISKKIDLKKIIREKIYLIGIGFIGIISYMWFSFVNKGDPLAFYSLQTNVGEHRSLDLILLPQVFYRYFVKIIPNLNWEYFPVVFTTLLELSVALLFLWLLFVSFKRINLGYWLYVMLGYLVPTLTGSFSSLPRYVIVLFPAFIFVGLFLEKTNKYLRLGIYVSLAIIAVIAEMLFFRGYFVS